MKVLDAVQYLRDEKFTENKQYEWINPILRKVINNEFTDKDIGDLICLISKRENKLINNIIDEANTDPDPDNNLNLSKILEISEIKNYGLLNLEEPITLNNGLNVFYGENGVGKSSLFKALCDVFDLNNFKKCIPNINNEDVIDMKCKLKILDNDNNQLSIDGCENYSRPDNVKIFDNYISNNIVTNDQKNEFVIPYLKQQYFYVLRSLLEELDKEFDIAINNIENDINDTYDFMVNDFDISDLGYKGIEHMIKGVTFDDIDAKELLELEKKKTLLKTDVSKILNMTYRDREDDIDLILEQFSDKKTIDNIDKYTLKYSKNYCKTYNENLKKYNNLKKMYEENNISNLSKYIQSDWITSEEWMNFIYAGIDFVETLNKKDQISDDNKCPYCNQELKGKSKELLNKYKNIKNTYKSEIEKLEKEFKLQRQELEQVIKFIKDDLEKYNNNINKVFIDGKQKKLIDIDINELRTMFINMLSSIKGYKEIDNVNLEYYKGVIQKYVNTRTHIKEHINKTTLTFNDKNDEIKRLDEKIETLNLKKTISKNYPRLNKVVENLKIVEDINYKQNQLPTLKRNLSKLENSFSSESSMKIFLEKLNNEYSALNLIPPSQFSLKPQKEKRQVRIGQHKISDIYSEGELKIHSLAEFFAESEINNVKGIYIFDDPVNSLDYERIGYVKDRITKLVDDGNQVIIFTHNIYFLNSLLATEKDKVNKITKANNQVYIMKDTVLGERESEIKKYGDKIKSKILYFEKNPGEVDKHDIGSVYDLISGCLESFVENKLLKGLIGRYRPNIRMFGLPELKKLDNELIDDVYNLYNTTSRYCNRHSSPIEAVPADLHRLKADYELCKKVIGLK